MTDENLSWGLDIDTVGANRSISDFLAGVLGLVGGLNKMGAASGESTKKMGNDLRELIGTINAVDNAVSDLISEVKTTFAPAFDRATQSAQQGLGNAAKSASLLKAEARAAAAEVTALGRQAEASFKAASKEADAMARSIRQADMSPWAKQADTAAEKIKNMQANVAGLYLKLQETNVPEEQRKQILNDIERAQTQIVRLQEAQAQAAAKAAEAAAREAQAELEKENALKRAKQARADASAAKSEALALREAEQQAKTFESAMQRVERVFGAVDRDVNAIKTALRQADMSQSQRMADEFAQAIQRDREQVEQLRGALQGINLTQEQRAALDARILEINGRINDLVTHGGQAVELQKIREQTEATAKAATASKEAYRQLGQSILSAAGEIRNYSAVTFTALSVGITGATKKLGELSDGTTAFKAVAGATNAEVSDLVKTAKGLEGTKTSAGVLAAVELTRAGLAAREATADLAIFNKEAIASGEALGQVADVTLKANRAMGLANSEIANTADILNRAANVSSTSVTEFGAAVSIAGSTAKTNSQTLLSFATVFGLLRDNGVEAEQAATGYKNALQAMNAPTKQTRDAMDALYKTTNAAKKVFTENGEMRDFMAIMDELRGKLEGFSKVKQAKILSQIFPDERSLNIVQTYLGITEEKIRANSDAMADWRGDVERTAAIMRESLGNQLRDLSKGFEDLQTDFAEAMLPTLRDLLSTFRDLVGAFDDLSQPMKNTVTQGALIVAGVSGVLGVFSQLVLGIGAVVRVFDTLRDAQIAYMAKNKLVEASNAELATSFAGVEAKTAAAAAPAGGLVLFAGGLAAITLAGIEVIHQIEELNRALENLDQNLGVLSEVEQKTKGALGKVERLQASGNPVTAQQMKDAVLDAFNQARTYNEQIDEIKTKWQELADLRRRLATEDSNNIDLPPQIAKIVEELKAYGVKDESTFNAKIKALQGIVSTLDNKLGQAQAMNAGDVFSKTGLDAVLHPQQPKPNPDDSDTPDGKGDTHALQQFLSSLETSTNAQIKSDQLKIASTEQFSQTFNSTYDGMSDRLIKTADELVGTSKKTGTCYEGFAETIRQSEIAAGILDKNGKVLDRQRSIYAEILATPHLNAYEFNRTAQNMVKRGVLEEYRPGNMGGVTRGSMFVLPAGWYQGNKAGHVGALDEKGFDYSDHKDNILARNPGLFKNPGVHFYRYKGSGGEYDGPTKQELEQLKKAAESQAAVNRLQQELNVILAKRAEIEKSASPKKDDMLATIDRRATQLRGEIDAAKKGGEEARQKLIQQRVEGEQRAKEQLEKMEAEHAANRAALLEDEQAKIEAMRDAELKKSAADQAKSLDKFKGTAQQKSQIEAAYATERADINAKYDKQRLDLAERRARELQQLDNQLIAAQIAALADGPEKQKAALDLETKQQTEALENQIADLEKKGQKFSAAWQDLELQKTQITENAARRRADLEFEASQHNREMAVAQQLADLDEERLQRLQQINDARTVGTLTEAQAAKQTATVEIDALERKLTLQKQSAAVAYDSYRQAMSQAASLRNPESARGVEDAQQKLDTARRQAAETARQLRAAELSEQQRQREQFKTELQQAFAVGEQAANAFVSVMRDAAGEIGESVGNVVNGLAGIGEGAVKAFTTDPISGFLQMAGSLFSMIHSYSQQVTQDIQRWKEAVTGIVQAQNDVTVQRLQQRIRELEASGQDATALKLTTNSISGQNQRSQLLAEFQKKYGYRPVVDAAGNLDANRVTDEYGNTVDTTINRAANDLSLSPAQRRLQQLGPLKIKELQQAIAQLQSGFEGSQNSQTNNAADILRTQQQREAELAKAHYERLAGIRLSIAQTTATKLDDIDVQAANSREEIERRRVEAMGKEGLLVDPGVKLTEAQQDRLRVLNESFSREQVQLTRDTERQKREVQSQEQADADAATFAHAQAEIDLLRDGGAKQLRQLELNKEQRLAQLDNEMMKHAEGTVEYTRLQQQKVDATKAADDQIAKFEEEMAIKLRQQLNSLASDIAQLRISLNPGAGASDYQAAAKASLNDLFEQERQAYQDAYDNYGDDYTAYQQLTLQIGQKYALLRQQAEIQAQDQVTARLQKQADALKSARQRQYDADAKAHTAAIQGAQTEIDKLSERNRLLQAGIDLKNEEARLALKAFDATDLTDFAKLKSQTGYEDLLRQGFDLISNPTDIPDSTYSEKSVNEAIQAIVDQLTIQNENLFGLEEYDPTNPAKNKEAYLKQVQEIAAFQAKAAEESLKREKLTTQQRDDLRTMEREAYQRYQQAMREQIQNTADAATQAAQDEIAANNATAASYSNTVAEHQFALSNLKTAYDTDIQAIEDKVAEALLQHDQWKVSVDDLKAGITGPLNDILATYNELTAAIDKTVASASRPISPAPSTSSGGNWNISGGSSDYQPYSGGGSSSGSSYSPYTQTAPADAAPKAPNASTVYIPYVGFVDVNKHAKGALIPPGYPNDSYPMYAETGEAVLPAWLVDIMRENDRNKSQPPAWFRDFQNSQLSLLMQQSSHQFVDNSQHGPTVIQIYDTGNPTQMRQIVADELRKAEYKASRTAGLYFDNLN